MKPRIDATEFGSITVDGTVFDHDLVISPDGEVSKRKKKLSKAVYGTSHTISLQEQLIQKDIPLLRSVIPDEFTAVLVKGRDKFFRNLLGRPALDLPPLHHPFQFSIAKDRDGWR